ncbi:MAG: ribonuclease III [Desulfarculaceae bacterium]|nr:ribonuclease III [Desulfarculaceae bacterium]MCF8074186.1 ribonuclease III [Desulfarculaceae bacterium]MCF8102767.1 ribonuclease III [Desulfarculaceae bacterium]MCF8116378.1 ribonuclease III [Desulfarculaceae bacterium]
MDPEQTQHLQELARRLGHEFSNPALLEQALRHSSYIHEHPDESGYSYERLEFLGDAVLELAITEMLFARFPGASEGQLSKARAGVVNEARLAETARTLGVGPCLLLGRGEELQGGRDKPSILADVIESLAAAIYLDAGLEAARKVLLELLGPAAERSLERAPKKDFKTRLQEEVQEFLHLTPVYDLLAAEGPDHAKVFTVAVTIDGRSVAQGRGHSKKEAEQEAARAALDCWRAPEG